MYLRYNWSHPNRPSQPYDFKTNDGERKLNYLLDDRGPLNPDEWADLNIFLMARGCLKTTTTLGITNWAIDKFPVEFYMTAPTQDPPITEYVSKFENNARNTPLYDDGRVEKEALGHHKYKKEVPDGNGSTNTQFSALKTQTAYNPDRLRGPHCHGGVVDEAQDITQESFTMFLQMIDQGLPNEPSAPFPTVFLIGTPKEKNTLLHRLYLLSNQRTWDGDEQEWIDESDVGEFKPESGEDDDTDVDSYTIKSWHIDQPNSPLESHNESQIKFNKQIHSKRQFQNEVLAQFYSPESDLLSDTHVTAAFDDSRGFRNSRRHDDTEVVITADWGGGSGKDASDTVFTVGEFIEDEGRFVETDAYINAAENDIRVPYQIHVLKHEFLDHSIEKPAEMEKLGEWIERFSADTVLVDQGHNGSRRTQLRNKYGDIILGCKYGNVSPPTEVRWKENNVGENTIANVDKTHVCEKFVDYFRDGRFVIPSQDIGAPEDRGSDAQRLISQLTAPFEEQKDVPTGKRLYIQNDRNDDSFHTFNYQFVANDFIQALEPNIGPESITMNTRVGY